MSREPPLNNQEEDHGKGRHSGHVAGVPDLPSLGPPEAYIEERDADHGNAPGLRIQKPCPQSCRHERLR